MMRKKLKTGEKDEESTSGGESSMTVTPVKNLRRSSSVLEEQMSELNEMVERIGKIDISGITKPSGDPEPSDADGGQNQEPILDDKPLDFGVCDLASMTNRPVKTDRADMALLPTMALMANNGSELVAFRTVLNSSSMCHLLTEKCRKKLNIPLLKSEVKVVFVGGVRKQVLGEAVIKFSPYFNHKRVFEIRAFVVKEICCHTPFMKVDPSIKEQMGFFKLADPNFDIPGAIDMLIGTEFFPVLIKGGPSFSLTKYCGAVQSYFGWVVAGRVPVAEFNPKKPRMDLPGKPPKTGRGSDSNFCNVNPPDNVESQ